MTGRAGEGEPTTSHCLNRRTGREHRRVECGLGAERVLVDRSARRKYLLEEARRMAAKYVVLGRRVALDEREPLVQDVDPSLRFRVRPGRMQPGECLVAYDVDERIASSSSSSDLSPCARPIR